VIIVGFVSTYLSQDEITVKAKRSLSRCQYSWIEQPLPKRVFTGSNLVRSTIQTYDTVFRLYAICAHEWAPGEEPLSGERVISDADGNLLANGDTVSAIKDLKVKGSSSVVKVGIKVKNICLVQGDHDIDYKIDGIGAMKLTSMFVKKV
jgi:protein PhnA